MKSFQQFIAEYTSRGRPQKGIGKLEKGSFGKDESDPVSDDQQVEKMYTTFQKEKGTFKKVAARSIIDYLDDKKTDKSLKNKYKTYYDEAKQFLEDSK